MPSVAAVNAAPKRYKAASLFAGGGGASLGYKMAGFDVVYANEFIKIAADTYRANATKSAYVDELDVRKVTPDRVMKLGRFRKGELDLLDMSPPCTAFSSMTMYMKENYGKVRRHAGTENVEQRIDDLFFEGARLLRGLQPKTFVAENVTGLTHSIHRGQFLLIMEALQSCGYEVVASIVDASRLGVPQKRRRLIFVGVRKDLTRRGLRPELPRALAQRVTVEDALPHIFRVREVGGGAWTRRGSEWRMERGPGYVRSNRPSHTITASCATSNDQGVMSCGGWVETADGIRRQYTIPELKRVFGYPADYKLLGNRNQQWARLGLSHVPLSTYYVGATLAENVLDRIGSGESTGRTPKLR